MLGNNLVVTVAQEEGSEGREIAKQLARSLRLNYVDEAVLQLATEGLTHREVENYMRELAGQGRVMFVDCGANFILGNVEGVINMLIRAPLTTRIERVMQSQQLDLITAEQRLYQLDEQYASYIRCYYGSDWTNPDLYDLVISTKTIPVAGVVASLCQFLQAFDQSRYREGIGEYSAASSTLTKQVGETLGQNYPQVLTGRISPN